MLCKKYLIFGGGGHIKAFTLAEILITLSIIGVVAALTIPSLIADNQKKTLMTQFQKAYNIAQNATNLAQAQYGEIKNWEFSTGEEFAQYYLPFLNVAQKCGYENKGCFNNIFYSKLNGEPWQKLDGHTTAYTIKLVDGMSALFFYNGHKIGVFSFDINGAKAPNAYGKDLFEFCLYQYNNVFAPCGTYMLDADNKFVPSTDAYLESSCLLTGVDCSAKVVRDGFKFTYF